jgi:hypothetical protein
MAGQIIFLVLAIAFFFWLFLTESGQRVRQQSARNRAAKKPKSLSQVGEKTAAGLACPKCGGTQFKAGRKTSTKLTHSGPRRCSGRRTSCVASRAARDTAAANRPWNQTDPLPLFGEWLSLTLGEGGSVGIRVLVGVDGEDVLQAHQREQPVRDRRRVSQDERSAVLGEFPSRVNQDLDA